MVPPPTIGPTGSQRFAPQAAEFAEGVLAQVVERVIASQPVGIELLHRFCGVFIQDSTTVALPEGFRDRCVVYKNVGATRSRQSSCVVVEGSTDNTCCSASSLLR